MPLGQVNLTVALHFYGQDVLTNPKQSQFSSNLDSLLAVPYHGYFSSETKPFLDARYELRRHLAELPSSSCNYVSQMEQGITAECPYRSFVIWRPSKVVKSFFPFRLNAAYINKYFRPPWRLKTFLSSLCIAWQLYANPSGPSKLNLFIRRNNDVPIARSPCEILSSQFDTALFVMSSQLWGTFDSLLL